MTEAVCLRRQRKAQCALAAASLLTLAVLQPAAGGTAKITLPKAGTTSAGVFDSSGALVRTLWSAQPRSAGSLEIEWDGHTDDGEPVSPKRNYVARVAAHNVRYVWEGVIGNTSAAAQGASIHRAYNPIHDMAIDAAGNAFYVVGYNERQNAMHRFKVSDPQRKMQLAHDDYTRIFRYAATDGTLTYFANVGLPPPAGRPSPPTPTFVVALRVSDGAEHPFAAGRVEKPDVPELRWQSAIDYDMSSAVVGNQARTAPSGLAVQQRGDYLFVAHRAMDEIRVFDKRTGVLLDRIGVVSPGDMDVAPDDSLWVICEEEGRPAVARYHRVGTHWQRAALLAEGLVAPAAMGVSPVDGTLVVADAGTEQLKAFDPNLKPAWTLGHAGGYVDGSPNVTTDKFWLSAGPTYVAFAADGSFWLGDPGNLRNLHFSAQRRYVEQIMYMPASYAMGIDAADPRRVFRHFLEFQVDYSRPIRESWTLVRNWLAPGLHERYRQGSRAGFQAVTTLGNGRTYATLHRVDTHNDEVVELAEKGIRLTGAQLDPDTLMYADGSLRMHRIRLGSLKVYERRLAELDAEGNPRWDAPAELGGVVGLRENDPYYHDVPRIAGINPPGYPITSGGVIVSFNPGRSAGFHLGGIRLGEDKWLWRASPSGTWEVDAHGNILNADGRYEIGRNAGYKGNVARVAGDQIIAGYHGEGWNAGQANQWLHFLDDGLFVGQFGEPVYVARNRAGAHPGSAGNAFSPQLVRVKGKLYLWHNDESVHGGLHRWRIDGTDEIRRFQVPIRP